MDSSLDDILDRLNRGENPSLSGQLSDDGLIRHGGLEKAEAKSTVMTGLIAVLAAVITMLSVLYPLRSAFQSHEERPNTEANVGGKTVSAEELYAIGNQYYYGNGMEQDYAKARSYYEQAAEMGNADALNDLGVLYHYGYGVEQDYVKARDYYEQAAERGSVSALTNLGILYEYGYGVEQDYKKAEGYFEKAAEMDNRASTAENLARIREKMKESPGEEQTVSN